MVDINCDMGEGMDNDAALMPFISSANIACGYHAGDVDTMKRTIALCLEHNVAIGAHPSFADRENFGRTAITMPPERVVDLVTVQLNIIDGLCRQAGAVLHHVKPHGALYNMAAKDLQLAAAIAQAVSGFNTALVLYGLAGSFLIIEGEKAGLKTASEVFADRTYTPGGSLTPRDQPNALIEDEDRCVQQVLQMIQQQTVTATDGSVISIKAETICVHGDGRHAVSFARRINESLKSLDISIKAI